LGNISTQHINKYQEASAKDMLKIALSVGLALVASALPAQAQTFQPNVTPVPEVHSVGGANTAGSFAASAMMGGYGHSGLQLFQNWEPSIVSQCAAATRSSVWPGTCNPTGMAAAMANLTGKNWIQFTWLQTDQVSALNDLVSSLKDHGSPAIVPILGQADHWVAVLQVTATQNTTTGSWTISNVKYQDGGPPDGLDGATNSYTSGLTSYSGSSWKNVYFKVIQNINPLCDPCTADPWYNNYVLMWEPPPAHIHANFVAEFPRAPGVFQGSMNEPLAHSLVWKSLAIADVSADPEIWAAIADGVAGTASEVNGVLPSGDRWDYFLVPILSSTNTVKAFVQMSADDGSFEGIHVPTTLSQFNPVTRAKAELLALGALNKGEKLTSGILTWDPRSHTSFAKSPTSPYYEFAILNRTKQIGVIRVGFNTGTVVRSQ
jgi:hypothetical protein